MELTEYNEDGEAIVHGAEVAHYHGDFVRLFFVAAALLMLVMQFTGDSLFPTPAGLILFVAVLVIAAGITSPAQKFIHWINLFLAFIGLAIFGALATQRLHSLRSLFTHDGLTGIIAILFLMALYFTTRTVRANLLDARQTLETSGE